MIIEKIINKRSTGYVCRCDWCNEKFERQNYLVKRSKNQFCSNVCKGKWTTRYRVGENSANWGRRFSEETKRKMGEASLGRKHTEEAKKKISKAKLGDNNYNWKGGKRLHEGYVLIYNPKHSSSNLSKCVPEHRLIMEKHLGRILDPKEIVHHENEVRDDNRIENLLLLSSKSEHIKIHDNLKKEKVLT